MSGEKRAPDETWPGEEAAEALWTAQGGVDPKTGKAWLTPRMGRCSAGLVASWKRLEAKKGGRK